MENNNNVPKLVICMGFQILMHLCAFMFSKTLIHGRWVYQLSDSRITTVALYSNQWVRGVFSNDFIV